MVRYVSKIEGVAEIFGKMLPSCCILERPGQLASTSRARFVQCLV